MAGHLSSLQQIPDQGLPAIRWAFDRIVEGRMSQKIMLAGLNERLLFAGLPEASRSSFNRYVLHVRDGKIQRPDPFVAPLASSSETVLDPNFRERLLAAVGSESLRQIEGMLASLAAQRVA